MSDTVKRIRVELPFHLRTLAHVGHEVEVQVAGAVTVCSILNALEESYPMLRGTVREHGNGRRRAFLRFFACGQDFSHADPDEPLPKEVAEGKEAFVIIGAIAGG